MPDMDTDDAALMPWVAEMLPPWAQTARAVILVPDLGDRWTAVNPINGLVAQGDDPTAAVANLDEACGLLERTHAALAGPAPAGTAAPDMGGADAHPTPEFDLLGEADGPPDVLVYGMPWSEDVLNDTCGRAWADHLQRHGLTEEDVPAPDQWVVRKAGTFHQEPDGGDYEWRLRDGASDDHPTVTGYVMRFVDTPPVPVMNPAGAEADRA